MKETQMTTSIPTVSDADALAASAHAGQVDKAGRPYINHPRAVAALVLHLGDNAVMAALLHDIVEDTDVTLDDLRDLGYPGEVVRAVDSVTKRDDETYMDLIRRAAADPLGRLIKLADNTNNSDPVRLALLDDEQRAWFTQKYAKARKVLEAQQ
jgi:(p)ppGpp synthase/HD superfamily hydrolase